MSVLNTLKGKFANVQQESLWSLAKVSTRRRSAETELTSVDTSASHELLTRYQCIWERLHTENEELAHRAQSVDNQVTSLFQYLDQQNTALTQFTAEMSGLVQLVVDVNIARDKIMNLEKAFGELESALTVLEDVCNQRKHVKIKQEHEIELVKYRQSKANELVQVKADLAKTHAAKVQKHEEQVTATLRERQKVFEEAHREQMVKYMTTGEVEHLPASPVHTSDLADVELDQDRNELEQFLGSEDDFELRSDRPMQDSETDEDLEDLEVRVLREDSGTSIKQAMPQTLQDVSVSSATCEVDSCVRSAVPGS